MPKLSRIQHDTETKELAIDLGEDGTLHLTVRPGRFTIGLTRRMTRAVADSDMAAVADAFFAVVSAWDLTDDKGVVLPLDASTIDQLSLQTFSRLFSNIGEAVSPNGTTSSS